MTFGNETVMNTPRNVRIMAEAIYDCGVKPEIELFDSGDIELARDMFADRIAAHARDGAAGSRRKLVTAFLLTRRPCCTRAIACRRV